DIPQGRPWVEPEPPVHRSRIEQETYVDPEVRGFFGAIIPPPSLYPRVVLRFADEKNLWISGMLAGASELAEAPAVVDVPLGAATSFSSRLTPCGARKRRAALCSCSTPPSTLTILMPERSPRNPKPQNRSVRVSDAEN